MSTIQDLFQQAQLAEAAYANLWNIGTNSVITDRELVRAALRDRDNNMSFSEAQADAFVNQWKVIDHIPDTAAGFSATIFERLDANKNGTGEFSLAIRGSTAANYLADFYADTALIAIDGIAVRQVVDLYNFWQRATTSAGAYRAAQVVPYYSPATPANAIQVGSSPYGIIFGNSFALADASLRTATGTVSSALSPITVAGHSLGGHLTMAFTRLFPGRATDATGINGLGFKLGNTTVDSLFSILGGAGAFTPSKIENIYGIAYQPKGSESFDFLST